jgi:uncharacterized protein (TIGR04255 family)
MQSYKSAPLPEYSNPPINEVVIAVEFLPLAKLQSPHIGLYWGEIKEHYPNIEVHTPIISAPEILEGVSFINNHIVSN